MGKIMKKETRKKKKRKKKHYLLRLLFVIGIGIGIYFLLTSELFTVSTITVEQNSYYSEAQVISLAEAETGGNLFEISTSEMKEKLLNDAYIKDAKIKRRFPDEIVITVTERKEAATIPYGSQFIIIDEDGIVLRLTDVETTLTQLTGLTISNLEPGTPLEVEEKFVLIDTMDMLSLMKENELFFKRIEMSPLVVKAYIYDNLTCEGRPENIMKNMDDLKDVLYDLYIKGIERGMIKVGGDGYYSFSPLVE